jgi:hypothetical protein
VGLNNHEFSFPVVVISHLRGTLLVYLGTVIKSRNLPTTSAIILFAYLNFSRGTRAALWQGSVKIKLRVFCDILSLVPDACMSNLFIPALAFENVALMRTYGAVYCLARRIQAIAAANGRPERAP